MNLPYRKLHGLTVLVLIFSFLFSTIAGAAGVSQDGGTNEANETAEELTTIPVEHHEKELATEDSSEVALLNQPDAPAFIVEDFEAGGVTVSGVRARVTLEMASRPEPVMLSLIHI